MHSIRNCLLCKMWYNSRSKDKMCVVISITAYADSSKTEKGEYWIRERNAGSVYSLTLSQAVILMSGHCHTSPICIVNLNGPTLSFWCSVKVKKNVVFKLTLTIHHLQSNLTLKIHSSKCACNNVLWEMQSIANCILLHVGSWTGRDYATQLN